MTAVVLEKARAGDDGAFAELTGPHLPALRLHCYRMLGSLSDAEDVVQETLLAAWRGLDGYAERASVRTWLTRIATNRCLNHLRARRRPAAPVAPFPVPAPSRHGDVTWLQPLPDSWLEPADPAPGPAARVDTRESVRLAFVAALQRLPGRQAAVLLLCDVLGYSVAETAELMDTTSTTVKGVLQRARASLPAPAPTHPATEHDAVAERFAAAFTAGDVDGVVALLTDDAVLAMPPAPHEYVGPAAVARFLTASFGWRADRPSVLLPVRASGQPAYACYLGEPGADVACAAGLFVLEVREGALRQLTRFQGPDLPERFGLPLFVPA